MNKYMGASFPFLSFFLSFFFSSPFPQINTDKEKALLTDSLWTHICLLFHNANTEEAHTQHMEAWVFQAHPRQNWNWVVPSTITTSSILSWFYPNSAAWQANNASHRLSRAEWVLGCGFFLLLLLLLFCASHGCVLGFLKWPRCLFGSF